MTGQRQQEKLRTRDRISEVATTMFIDRGFDAVTVAEIAAAAGVSKVTVFAHFARKEDLMLDRAPQAEALLVEAVRDRPAGVSPLQSLRELAVRLGRERHPLSGLNGGNDPFLRTVLASPALIARVRELGDGIEQSLADALAAAPDPIGEPRLLAALIIATYRTVVAESVARIASGDLVLPSAGPGGTAEQDQTAGPAEAVADHERRLSSAFDALDAAAAVLAG